MINTANKLSALTGRGSGGGLVWDPPEKIDQDPLGPGRFFKFHS